jgi:hypothetical protein
MQINTAKSPGSHFHSLSEDKLKYMSLIQDQIQPFFPDSLQLLQSRHHLPGNEAVVPWLTLRPKATILLLLQTQQS